MQLSFRDNVEPDPKQNPFMISRRNFLQVPAAGILAGRAAPAQTRRLRAGIIGHTGQGNYGHDLHLSLLPFRNRIEIIALADPDPAGRAKRAAEIQAARTYADYREMLEKERPEFVLIAPRWTTRHLEYLLAAAGIGAHGVLEKPIASDLQEADAMVAAAERKNLKWSIAFNFRVHPAIQRARQAVIEQGMIGQLLEMRARGKEDQRAGGEDLIVLGSHQFDLMRFFAGDPQWCTSDIQVQGQPARQDQAHPATEPVGLVLGDRIEATFGFAKGIMGYFASAKTGDGNQGRWGIDLYGTRGIVSIRNDAASPVHVLQESSWAPGGKPSAWRPIMMDDTGKNPTEDKTAGYRPIIEDLLRAIREDRRPQVSLQDGRAAQEMVQAVYEAYLQGGRVSFPLSRRISPLM